MGLVTSEGVLDLPGRVRPQVVRDEDFRPLVRAFADTGGQRLRLLWRAGAPGTASPCTGTGPASVSRRTRCWCTRP
ncbi:hypothetical protein O1M54_42630 [Streptomyces diastatochromogenes]|nr:hypothetical protein [Streptomyces diastatochromogenes]